MTVPHVGRYRLFQRAPTGPLWVCRVCRESFRKENLERHFQTEWRKWHDEPGRIDMCPWDGYEPCHLALRLAYLLRVRRSRRRAR